MGASAEHEAEGGWAVGPLLLPIPLFNQVDRDRVREEPSCGARMPRAVPRSSRGRAGRGTSTAHDQAEHYRKVVLPLRNKIVEQTQLQYNAVIGLQLLVAKQRRDRLGGGVHALRACWAASIWTSSSAAGCPPVRLLSVQNHLLPRRRLAARNH